MSSEVEDFGRLQGTQSSVRSPDPALSRWVIIALITVLGVVPAMLWYKSGYLLSGGDFTAPFEPIKLFLASLSGWSDSQGVGGASTVNMLPMAFPYLALIALLSAVGLPANLAEAITFALIFVLPGWTMWALLGHWLDGMPGRFAGSVLYMLNPFTMIMWQSGDAIGFIAYGLSPLVILLVDRALREQQLQRSHWLLVGLTALLLATPGSNPPTIVAEILIPVLIIIICRWRGGTLAGRQKARRLVVSGGIALGVNLWWLIPGFTSLANGSLLPGFSKNFETLHPPGMSASVPFFDQLTGFGYWAWHAGYLGVPYYRFAQSYGSWWANILVLLPLILGAFGVGEWFRAGSDRYFPVVAAGIFFWLVGFLLSAGFQGPFGLYEWAYVHVPGFTAFRAPWEVFSAIQVMGLAVLCAVAVDAYARRVRTGVVDSEFRKVRTDRRKDFALIGLVAILAAGVVHPLFGNMFKNRMPDGSLTSYSHVPGYVTKFANFVNDRHECGIFMPESAWTSYIAYSWYKGGYSNVNALFRCTILEANSTPTLPGQSVAGALDQAILDRLPGAQMAQALGRLGMTDVVIPQDEDFSFYQAGIPPRQLASYFESNANVFRKRAFGPWLDFVVPSADVVARVNAKGMPPQVVGHLESPLVNAPADLTMNRQNDGNYLLTNLNGSAMVTKLVAYDPGWRLEISPSSPGSSAAQVRHFMVDGYANGWVVDGHGTYVIRFVYKPRQSIFLGAVASLLCFGLILYAGYRRRGAVIANS